MRLEDLARSQVGKEVIKLIEEVKAKVLDIKYKPEITNENRIALADILDEELIDRMKRLRAVDTTVGQDDWS